MFHVGMVARVFLLCLVTVMNPENRIRAGTHSLLYYVGVELRPGDSMVSSTCCLSLWVMGLSMTLETEL